MDLRDAIHRIALEWPCYRRPRITRELRDQGWKVNPKRVYRLMREDNLLCLRKRKFVITTDSNHGRKIYPNLAARVAPTSVNQLWVADITYVRLEEEFIFVAVILDAYSRRVIGWAVDRNMEDELTLTALGMALGEAILPSTPELPAQGGYGVGERQSVVAALPRSSLSISAMRSAGLRPQYPEVVSTVAAMDRSDVEETR